MQIRNLKIVFIATLLSAETQMVKFCALLLLCLQTLVGGSGTISAATVENVPQIGSQNVETSWQKVARDLEVGNNYLWGDIYFDKNKIEKNGDVVILDMLRNLDLVNVKGNRVGVYDYKGRYHYKSERFKLTFKCQEQSMSLTSYHQYSEQMGGGIEYLDAVMNPELVQSASGHLLASTIYEIRAKFPKFCEDFVDPQRVKELVKELGRAERLKQRK